MNEEAGFVLENAGWPALLVDEAGTIRRANQAAVELFGPVVTGGSSLLSTIWAGGNPAPPPQFLADWERSPTPAASLAFRSRGGTSTTYLTSICPCKRDGRNHFLLQLLPEVPAGFSLPERRTSATDAVAMKQKLDCALQLARTVALDFNNALTSILGHTSLVLGRMEPGHPWRASLLEVEKSAAKAAEIANDLGTFSRQEKEGRGQAAGNLNLVLQRSIECLQQNTAAAGVEWDLQFERKLFASKFDEAKLQQAFIKVLENAVQAMPAPGRITVQTRNLEFSAPTQDRNVHLGAGAYVGVEITDTGSGIEQEVLPRIFEPFFTTKRGNHRGLGLAWVYGIVTNHGGSVSVTSQPGEGTSVRIYLPAEKRIVKDNGVSSSDLSGTETILFVDDEDLLLTMGQTILSAFGYRVVTANSGQKALEILTRNQVPIDLVITDLVMPAMSGRELMERIHHSAPTMRILCTSGYVWPAGQANDATYLQKPFTSQELLLKVKQALNSEPAIS